VNLLELFNTRLFRVPDYQRGYAWGEKQLIEFWDDLEEILEIDGQFKSHYTGTLYLEECKPSVNEQWISGVQFFYVVDGQQRLTTITILLLQLLRLAKDGYSGETTEDLTKTYFSKTNTSGKSTVYKFCYDATDHNYAFLLNRIYLNQSIILQDKDLNVYRQNLLFANEFFHQKLQALHMLQRETIFKKITTALEFDLKILESDLDVQEVFETMNNRGKPLSTLEKLKNRLIYLSAKLPNTPEDKRQLKSNINIAWGKIYSHLARNAENILNEDVFLSAHLSLYRKPAESVFSENVAEEKVFQMFCNRSEKYDKDESGDKEPSVSYSKISDYVISLSGAAPAWHQVHNSNTQIVRKLLLLNGSKEIKVFIMALILKSESSTLCELLLNLERLFFRNRTLWCFDERIVATWGRDIYCNEDDAASVNKRLEDLLRQPIAVETLIKSMNNLFTYERGNKGFHRWGALKYFLFNYEEYLKERARETDDKLSIDDYEDTTIEHIIPQQWRDNWSDIVNPFISDAGSENADLAQKILVNTLGNLTILKNGKNSSLGKLAWPGKRERYRTGSYNEIDISKRESWTKLEVYNRGIDMLTFLERRIEALKMSPDQKLRLLFYDDKVLEQFK